MASTKPVGDVKPTTSASAQVVQEYIVKMPLNKSKKFNVMRFGGSQKVDVKTWTQVRMERENNLKEFKADEDQPKFGAGSEFGREQREESRRKKYGIISKKYNPEDQPWLLKLNGKGGKKYKGIREGGVTENTSYYVFTQAADGTFEAYPVAEWYNFTPIQRYKALTAEEAEIEFTKRDKVMNFFNIMMKKRKAIEEEDEDGEKLSGKKKNRKQKQSGDFKISDMDDWTKDSSDSDDDDERDEDEEKSTKKNAKKGKAKKKEDVEEEGREESDEGDFDDREVDYITGSSSSEAELEDEKVNREMKGVEDEEALRKLDNSEDEEEAEENKETEENTEQEKAPEPEKKKKKKESKKEGGKQDSSGDSSSDTSDSDFDDTKVHAVFMQKQAKKNGSDNSAGSSRANTPTKFNAEGKGSKRKLNDSSLVSNKKAKTESQSGSSAINSLDGITEEAIRRYLSRKPMTASELLQKFKSKKTKVPSDQLVTKIADELKKMDLVKRKIKDKMYLSVKL